MKKLLLLFLLVPTFLFGQSILAPPNTFGTATDMRLQVGTPNVMVRLSGLTSLRDGNGGDYVWDATSTASDDGFVTLKVVNVTTGRWIRIGNGNTLKGTAVLSGAALTTAYTINYSSALPFTPLTVIVIPRTANAAVPSWVSTITNTGFTVNFTSIPVLGTNNIGIDFIIVKQ